LFLFIINIFILSQVLVEVYFVIVIEQRFYK